MFFFFFFWVARSRNRGKGKQKSKQWGVRTRGNIKAVMREQNNAIKKGPADELAFAQSQNGGGSLRSIGKPRRTSPRKDAVAEVSGTEAPLAETET